VIKILALNSKVGKQLQKYRLESKFNKQLKLLSENPKHPSLHLELLEPKKHGIYRNSYNYSSLPLNVLTGLKGTQPSYSKHINFLKCDVHTHKKFAFRT